MTGAGRTLGLDRSWLRCAAGSTKYFYWKSGLFLRALKKRSADPRQFQAATILDVPLDVSDGTAGNAADFIRGNMTFGEHTFALSYSYNGGYLRRLLI